MEDDKLFKVTRMTNGIKEYLTMNLDAMTMKATFYYVPRSCSYSFEFNQAKTLAAQYNGQVEHKEND